MYEQYVVFDGASYLPFVQESILIVTKTHKFRLIIKYIRIFKF